MNTTGTPSVTVDDGANATVEMRACAQPETSTPAGHERRTASRPIWRSGWVGAAALAVTFGRWLEAADRRVFHLAPDEPGQLAMARWLAGGTRWNMFDHLTWRPGYAVVLAPLARIFDGGEALVRAALTLNAVAAGLSCVCLAVLVARWTDLSARGAAGVAAVVALAPAAISSSAYTWAESLITLVFLTTLVALQAVLDRRDPWIAVVAVGAAAFATIVHGRLLPLLPTTAVIVVLVLASDRRRSAAVGVAGLAITLGVVSVRFSEWVVASVWDAPSEANTADSVLSRLDAPGALLDSFAGQTWYQLVASVGMVGIGVGVALIALVRPSGRLRRADAATLLAATIPLVLTSVAFMSGRARPDQLVYGRYVDAIAWPLTALGLAWTLRRLRPLGAERRAALPTVVAVATVVTGAAVAVRHGDLLGSDVGLRMMVPGLLSYIGGADGVPILTITTIAAVLLVGLAVLAGVPDRVRVPRSALVTVAVVAVVWGGTRVHDAQAYRLNTWQIGDDVAEIEAIVPDVEPIGVVMIRDRTDPDYVEQRQRFGVYQLYLPDHEFVWERTPGRPTTRFLVAPSRVRALYDAGYVVVWRDPHDSMALWERDGQVARRRSFR